MILDAADRLVADDVHIRRVRIELPLGARRNPVEVRGFGTRDDVRATVALRLADRFLRPRAGVDVVGRDLVTKQIEGHRGELRRRAALQKQHRVVVGHAEQFAQIRFGALRDFDELVAAVTHFHHRHAGAAVVEQFRCRFFEHFQRQRRRTCGEIECAFHDFTPCRSFRRSSSASSIRHRGIVASSAHRSSRRSPARRVVDRCRLRTRRCAQCAPGVHRRARAISRTPCVLRPTSDT